MSRYIDANKLILHLKDELDDTVPTLGGRSNGKSIAYGAELGLKMAISYAETLSIADMVEVRHGEWGFDGLGWTCSECGEYALTNKAKMQVHSNYCPNCGARMDGGKNDGT